MAACCRQGELNLFVQGGWSRGRFYLFFPFYRQRKGRRAIADRVITGLHLLVQGDGDKVRLKFQGLHSLALGQESKDAEEVDDQRQDQRPNEPVMSMAIRQKTSQYQESILLSGGEFIVEK
ncbi:MAG: hypothetical protein Q7U44_11275 [Desulfuromonadales bacterium]|nr:hypothetical protein [Desulfuromonadales bacterium]